jgi:hypothetical protein
VIRFRNNTPQKKESKRFSQPSTTEHVVEGCANLFGSFFSIVY